MTHFQLPSSPLLAGRTRLFVSGDSGLERLVIEIGKQVSLELADLAGPPSTPTIGQVRTTMPMPLLVAAPMAALGALVPPLAAPMAVLSALAPFVGSDVVSISALSGSGTKRALSLKGLNAGMAMVLAADGGGLTALMVAAGKFSNHPDCDIDLIANVFRSSDAAKMQVLTRLLFNDPDNLFNESSRANTTRWKSELPCGTVSKWGASQIFHPVDYTYTPYVKPIPGMAQATARANLKREDLRYDDARLKRGCSAIRQRLARGVPSLVGLVYDPSGVVQPNGTLNENGLGGHTVPIVGCNKDATRFLYIDVYPKGSKLKYDGGYAGQNLFPRECNFLGMFELVKDEARGCLVLRTEETARDGFSGDGFLEVVSGPL